MSHCVASIGVCIILRPVVLRPVTQTCYSDLWFSDLWYSDLWYSDLLLRHSPTYTFTQLQRRVYKYLNDIHSMFVWVMIRRTKVPRTC